MLPELTVGLTGIINETTFAGPRFNINQLLALQRVPENKQIFTYLSFKSRFWSLTIGLDVPHQRDFICNFSQAASSKKFDSVIWSVFFFPGHYQSLKAVPDALEKLLTAWSLYNRFTCLHCVSCSSKQKPKWSLWGRELWKRKRWWIVSNKNLSEIYLQWVYVLCFLKFSVSFHANSEPLIFEGWVHRHAFTRIFTTPWCTQLNALNS